MLHRRQWSWTLTSKLYRWSILLANLINYLIITTLNSRLLLWQFANLVARFIFFVSILNELIYNPIQVLAALHGLSNDLRVHCVDFCYLWNFLVLINKNKPVNALFILEKALNCLLPRITRHKLDLYCSFLILILICIELPKIIHNNRHFL